jgi:hypothetical protein
VAVIVNPLPVLNITSTDTVSCEGSNITLTATGAASYFWLPLNLTGATVTDAPYTTTTYTVIGTSAAGCVDSSTITIQVNPLPVYIVSSSADSICVGDTVTLSVSGGDTYLWQPGNLTSSSITVTPAVTTIYSVVVSTLAGCVDSAAYEIYVGPDPIFTLTAKVNNVCANTPVQVAATGNAVSYLWQPGNIVGDTVVLYPSVTTTYTVTGFSSIGCTSTQTITINVNPNPVVSVSSTDTVICAGESTVLTASGAVTYLWLPTLQTISTITVSPAVTTTYTVIGTSATGCRDTATLQITVNPTPAVTASASSQSICPGGSTTLTANGAPSYVWMPGNLTGASITVTPAATTTYTVTGTNQFGCSDTALVTVVVNPLPVLAINISDPVICAGDTVTFSASGAATYNWLPGNLTGSSISVTPQVTTTYTVIGTSAAGCVDSATAVVTVNPLPEVTVFSHFTTICIGNSITAYAFGADNYVWYPINVTGNSATFAPQQNTSYYVLGTDTNGCSDTANINIYVNPLPVVVASASDTVTCAGSPVTLTATGTATYYAWTPGSLVGNTVTVNPTTTTQYILTGADTNSCLNFDTIVVTVNALPVVTVNSDSTVICEGDTATLTASGAVSYLWQPGNLTGSVISITPQVTTTYTVIGTSAAGCTDTTISTVVVNPRPDVTVFSHFTTICEGNSITAYASGANNYVWYPINVTGNTATFAPQQNTSYYVMGIDANGCSDTANINIYVNPLPVINGTASSTVICAGSPVTLTATGNASYYAWTPGNLVGTTVVVNPTTTTQYILMGVDTNSCIAYDTIVVNVNPTPVVTVNASSAAICAGDTATLTASGAISYLWLPGNQTTASISVNPAATTTYTVIGTNALGCSDTTVSTVVVNPLPEVTVFSHFTTICVGNSITAYASGADTYIWYPINLTGNTATFAPLQNTSYYVMGTDANGCSDTANINIIVNPLPVVNASASVTSACAGSSVTLTASGNASYYGWQPGNLTGTSVTVNPATTTQYILLGADTNGCINYDTVVVNIYAAPPVQVNTNTPSVCAGGSAVLTASGAVSYTWMPGNLTGTSVTVTPSATTTYTVTGTDANGCTATASVTVTVNTIASVAAAAVPDTICVGQSTTLNATGAATYTWMPGNLSGASVNVTPATTTTYTVIGSTASGCIDSATVTVVVNPLPEVSIVSHFSTVCAGQSITVNAYGADNYVWTPGNLTGSSITFSPLASVSYFVTGTDTNGCSDTANLPIVVNPLPVVVASASDTAVCAGSPVTLTASGALFYGWQPGNLAGSSIVVNPTVTTSYVVIGSDSNSCVGYDTIVVSVYTPQQVSVATNSVSICAGESVTLIANNAVSYLWMPGNIAGNVITVSPAATTTYTVTGFSADGCPSTATVTVVVNPLPVVNISASDTSVCAGNSVTLTASGATTYNWTPGNFSGSGITLVPFTTTTYLVTGTDANGCSDSASITINVLQAPTVSVNTSASTICLGDSAVLTANGAASYVWMPGNLSGVSITVTPSVTTTYTVTGTDVNGCESFDVVTINVNALPSVSASASASAVCVGEMVNLFASGASSYVWTPGNLNGASVTVTPSATTTYTVTGSDNNGCASTATVSVTVNPLPAVTASTNAAAICAGDSAVLTAGGAVSYTWQPGNITGASVVVNPTATTTYTVTGVSADGCEDNDTVTVTVNPLPAVVASASATTLCAGDSTVLSASGAVSYVWMPGNITGSSVTVTPSATTTYTVTGTNQFGCVADATVSVNVFAQPTVSASASDTAVCSGNPVTLTATGAASYTWMPGSMNGSSVTFTPATSATYTVTGTSAQGCTATATVAVTVNALPVITASASDTAVCAGQPTVLTATGANTYVWMPVSITGASVTVTPTATTTYTVTGIDGNGCVADATVTVEVNAGPQLVLTASDSLVCEGESITLDASGADTYLWLPINLTGASVGDAPYVTTTYTVIGTSANGCVDSTTLTVQVDPLPVVVITSTSDTICMGGNATLTASGGSNYLWQPGNQTTASITVTPAITSTYTVQVTTAAGCSDISSYEIVVMPNPAFVLSAKARTICSGSSVQLTASGNAVSYTWMPGNLTGSQVNVSPAVSTTYTVTGMSAFGCTTTRTISITVNPSPTVTVTSPDPVLCAGESAVLNASAVPAVSNYTWLPGMQTSASITVTPLATTTYSVVGVAANGCRDTTSIQVIVNPIPTISATPDDTVVCIGDSALITLSGAQTYTWQPGNFVTGNTAYIAPQGYEVYTITGTTAAGCSSTTTVILDVEECDIDTGSRVVNQWIPVPNPSNGMFNLKGVSNGQELVIKVFNAEGRMVYEENDYPMAGPLVFPLDLTDLRSGMYLIQITQGEDQQTVRVIIQQ